MLYSAATSMSGSKNVEIKNVNKALVGIRLRRRICTSCVYNFVFFSFSLWYVAIAFRELFNKGILCVTLRYLLGQHAAS